jgi:hypothetical protein
MANADAQNLCVELATKNRRGRRASVHSSLASILSRNVSSNIRGKRV